MNAEDEVEPCISTPLARLQVYFSGPPLLLGLSPTHGDDFSELEARALKSAVAVWPVTLAPFLPPDNLMVRLEGLVLAPPCGADLPRSVVDHLAAKWTSTLPIVVAMQVKRACSSVLTPLSSTVLRSVALFAINLRSSSELQGAAGALMSAALTTRYGPLRPRACVHIGQVWGCKAPRSAPHAYFHEP